MDSVSPGPATGGSETVRHETAMPGDTATKGDNDVAAVPSGSNVIVLTQFRTSRDLGPVQEHFASQGIATEILQSGSVYFLVTQARYDGFKTGSDGYLAKQRITEIGADYKGKAPEGYETFGPRYFSDAYGKKVN